MAGTVVFDNETEGRAIFATTATVAHTCNGTNRKLTVFVAWSLVPGMTFTVEYDGVPMTNVGGTLTSSNGTKSRYYELVAPNSGTHNVVVVGSSAGDIIAVYATSYTGCLQSASPIIQTDVTDADPRTVTGTTPSNNCWTVLGGTGGQTASTNSTMRSTSGLSQNGCVFDSNGPISPAGSFSMTISNGSNGALFMVALEPLDPGSLTATQGQTATLTAQLTFAKTLAATQGQGASLLALTVPAPGVVEVTPIQALEGIRPMPWRLDLYGVNSLDDLIRRLPELFTNTDTMLQWLFEDLHRVNAALGDGSPQGITEVFSDINIIGSVSGGTLTLGFQGTLGVDRGGTGRGTADAFAVLVGGTSPTGAHQSVTGVGTSGQVLTSQGAAALPTWAAASGAPAGLPPGVGWSGDDGQDGLSIVGAKGDPGPQGLLGVGWPGEDGADGMFVPSTGGGGGGAATTSMPDGTVGAPGWPFTNDPDTGLYLPGANRLAIATAGVKGLEVSAVGQLGSPTQFRCGLYSAATQTVPTNAGGSAVTFDSEDYDVGGLHDNVTNNSRITIPTGGAGLWQITYNIYWVAATYPVMLAVLTKNGTGNQLGGYVSNFQDAASAAAGVARTLSTTWTGILAAGDYIELLAYHIKGSDATIGNTSHIYANTFTATLLHAS